MNDAVLTHTDATVGMTSLLGLNGLTSTTPVSFSSGPPHSPGAEEDVSVAGVMLLSAMSVLMAIIGMITFALFVIALWWVISHVPVPAFVHHILTALRLSRS